MYFVEVAIIETFIYEYTFLITGILKVYTGALCGGKVLSQSPCRLSRVWFFMH